MANTVSGPYVRTVWVDGTTAVTQTRQNNLETQASVALNGFNGDLLSAFVLSGITCTKDGTVANQLDIAAGRAYITMSDGTRGLIVVAADNTHTTSALSSAYHLYLQPDGTWYWSTSNSPAANSLAIATVTTDASGNILAVTDTRVTNSTLLSGAAGAVAVPHDLFIGGLGGARESWNSFDANALALVTPWAGVANGHTFHSWDGSAAHTPLAVGAVSGGAATVIGHSGGFQWISGQGTAGSFGVPVIVAQAVNVHVTATTQQTILSFTPTATGLYRITPYVYLNNGTSGQKLLLETGFQDPVSNTLEFVWHSAVADSTHVYVLSGGFMTATVGDGYIVVHPAMVYAQSGTAITVSYQDLGGTPSDYVSAVIERLS